MRPVELFKRLPNGFRQAAIRYFCNMVVEDSSPESHGMECRLHQALGMFSWKQTLEGYDFWKYIVYDLKVNGDDVAKVDWKKHRPGLKR